MCFGWNDSKSWGNNDNPPERFAPIELKFQTKETKLYVPDASLSTKDDNKLLGQLKSGFIQTNNNNLNYLIDPTFTRVNRLFVLSFERIAGENNATKDHRDSFFLPNVEITKFNA